jgi:hypothetical protein
MSVRVVFQLIGFIVWIARALWASFSAPAGCQIVCDHGDRAAGERQLVAHAVRMGEQLVDE